MHSFFIRLARPEDARGIATVQSESWKFAYRGVFDEIAFQEPFDQKIKRWSRSLTSSKSQSVTFATLDDAGVVGFCTVGSWRHGNEQGCTELRALYVMPTHMGMGVGRALMNKAKAFARDQGADRMLVNVLDENGPARLFYEHHGMILRDDMSFPIRVGAKLYSQCTYECILI